MLQDFDSGCVSVWDFSYRLQIPYSPSELQNLPDSQIEDPCQTKTFEKQGNYFAQHLSAPLVFSERTQRFSGFQDLHVSVAVLACPGHREPLHNTCIDP